MTTPNLPSSLMSARNRAMRYQEIDGLPGLVTGIAFLLLGLQDWFVSLFQGFGFLGQVLPRLLLAFVPVALLIKLPEFLEWLRQSITYPRTGYVAVRSAAPVPEVLALKSHAPNVPPLLRVLDFFIWLSLVFLGCLIVIGSSVPGWLEMLTVCLFVLVTTLIAIREKGPMHEMAYSVSPAFVALMCCFLFEPRVPIMCGIAVFGGSTATLGLARLLIYLKRNPRPPQRRS